MLIRNSEKLAALATRMPDPIDFLIGKMFIAKDVQELAVAIRAKWIIDGEFSIDLPDNHNLMWDKAVALVQFVHDNPGPVPDDGLRATPKGMTTDWDNIVPPSDQARQEAKLWREKQGLVHVGARHVGLAPKQTVSKFDTRLPDIW